MTKRCLSSLKESLSALPTLHHPSLTSRPRRVVLPRRRRLRLPLGISHLLLIALGQVDESKVVRKGDSTLCQFVVGSSESCHLVVSVLGKPDPQGLDQLQVASNKAVTRLLVSRKVVSSLVLHTLHRINRLAVGFDGL